MSFSRTTLTLAGVAVLGIAGVGIGAGATFTDAVNATQTITAGTMSLAVSSEGAVTSSDSRMVTLPAFGPIGPTFETNNNVITVTNTGNIPVNSLAFQLGVATDGTTPSANLRDQMNVCIMSTDLSGTWVEGNGPLMTGVNLVPSVVQNPVTLVPGQSMTFSVNFYAGKNSTAVFGGKSCGTTTSDGPSTASRWGSYVTPASLTNAAKGGVVAPTLTFSFTG
jgi:hypothetical protein